MFYKLLRHLLSIFAFVIFLNGQLIAQEVPKLRIDPSKSFGGSISDYFNNVEYIPLETTKESLFGDITDMIVTDSSIVIYDMDINSILFFALNGKYITKINGSANRYPTISYDQVNKHIIIAEYNTIIQRAETHDYSLTGKALDAKDITIEHLTLAKMVRLSDDYYAVPKHCWLPVGEKAKDSIYTLLDIYKGNTLYKSLFPINQKESPVFFALGGDLRLSYSNDKGILYISTPLDNFLYKVSKDTAIKLYQFIFPADRVLSKSIIDSKDERFLDSVRFRLVNNSQIIKGVSNIYFNKNLLFFKINQNRYISYLSSDKNNQYNFIYNMESGKLSSFERISPDAMTNYLPILDYGNKAAIYGIIFTNGSFYSNISSLQMFAAKEASKSKNPQYPPVLQEYFKTQSRKSNPVIVRMNLKE